MTAEYSHLLWLLLLTIPVGLIQFREFARGRSDLLLLGGRWRAEAVRNLFMVKWFFSSLAFQIFLIFGVLALVGFSWGQRPVEESRRGVDLVVALDLSRSMLATDIEPSRLERSVATIRAITGRIQSLRLAIVGFKGDAVSIVPMTEDLIAIEGLLSSVSPALISAPGTDVERGLFAAMNAFPAGTYAHRLILLISDGESLSGDPLAVVERARREGFTIISLMAGTVEGAAIPISGGDVVRDGAGNAVISRADNRLLLQLAEQTGGEFMVLDRSETSAVVRAIEQHEQQRSSQGLRLVDVPRYRLFLSIALLALAVAVAIRSFKWGGLF